MSESCFHPCRFVQLLVTPAKCQVILLCLDFIAAYGDQRFPFQYHFIVQQIHWVLISSKGGNPRGEQQDNIISLQHLMYCDYQVKCFKSINQAISGSFYGFFFFAELSWTFSLFIPLLIASLRMHKRTGVGGGQHDAAVWLKSMICEYDLKERVHRFSV